MRRWLTVDQRGRVAEKIMELGNLVFAGLILGQVLSADQFDFRLAMIGVGGAISTYFVSLLIMKGGEK